MYKWILLPLRLFLGITFVYAGIQKLTDPQFFQASAPGYIGKQITAFATGSPLHAFLITVVLPHASFFGTLIAYGELAIGLGTLCGLLLRPAACSGMLISIVFFLTATWRVHPYFYGSDIVFVFCWFTLLLAGPTSTGLPSLDALLVPRLLARVYPKQRERFAHVLNFLVGVGEKPGAALNPADYVQKYSKQIPGNIRAPHQRKYVTAQRTKETRRNFLWGMLAGSLGMLSVAWLWNTVHTNQEVTPRAAGQPPTPTGTVPPSTTPGTSTPIAQANAVQNNSAVNFTLLSNGDPGILVRLNNGQFVAYDAVCTHAGCSVDYDRGSQLLVCPCHGAQFDPARTAAVVQGPASTPLTSVPIRVDNTTGAVTVANS